MGACGITVRQSDDGLNLLDTIVAGRLRKVNFSAFNVSEAIALLNQTIQEEIEQYRQKPSSKITDFYISGTFMHNFTNAAILAAESLYDYYQTGELIIYDYVGENYDPIEYHIKNFIVKGDDLLPLLAELESVQSPEHWEHQGWASGTKPIGSIESLNLATPILAGQLSARNGDGVRKRQSFLWLCPWISGGIPAIPRCRSHRISSGRLSKSLPKLRLPRAVRFTVMVTGVIFQL